MGQVGKALIPRLQAKYGPDSVVATDITKPNERVPCKFLVMDIMHLNRFEKFVKDNKVNYIIHFAAILSATGEKIPQKAKEINIRGLENVLDVALKYRCGYEFVLFSLAAAAVVESL